MATPDPAGNDNEVVPPGLPNCSSQDIFPNNLLMAKAWCAGTPPGPVASNRIYDALQRMNAKGGDCSRLANIGYYLMVIGAVRVVDGLQWALGGAAPRGNGNDGYMVIADHWTNWAYDSAHATTITEREKESRTLQQILAHELDHLDGKDHIPGNDFETPLSQVCSDLPFSTGPAQ